MDVNSLPLSPDAIDIFDYVQFKQGVDSAGLDRLVTKVFNKRLKNMKTKPTGMAKRQLRAIIRQKIVSGLSADNMDCGWCDPVQMKPVI